MNDILVALRAIKAEPGEGDDTYMQVVRSCDLAVKFLQDKGQRPFETNRADVSPLYQR